VSATSTQTVLLTDLRDLAAAALAPATAGDPPVHVDAVDALYPPALMVLWNNPWLEPGLGPGLTTMGPCVWMAHLQILCVGSRVEPGPGIRVIEELVTHVVGRLGADPYSWTPMSVSAPVQFPINRIDYLGARVNYDVPTSL
jgi:hypothetical protein